MSKARHSSKGETKMIGGVKPADHAGELVGGKPKVAKDASKSDRFKDGGVVGGKKSMMRLDRPGRKSGGRVGADCSPLSTSAKTETRSDGKNSN